MQVPLCCFIAYEDGFLTSITIPASVTFIDNDAFKYHNSLTLTVTPDSYAEEYAKARKIDYTYPD